MIPIACINEVVFGSLPRLLTVKGCLDKGSIGEKKINMNLIWNYELSLLNLHVMLTFHF